MLETDLKICYKNYQYQTCFLKKVWYIELLKRVKASTKQMGNTKLIPLLSIIVYLINTQSSFKVQTKSTFVDTTELSHLTDNIKYTISFYEYQCEF